jgi:peptide/nickel transport system ATP-binding protein
VSTLLEVEGLSVHFPVGRADWLGRRSGSLRAVDEVSLRVERGETLAVVGESGSGKTTLGRAVLRAVEPTAGHVYFQRDDKRVDITVLDRRELRAMRRRMQMIFQDPYASLNPRMTVRDVIGEPLVANGMAKGQDLQARIVDIAGLCGLSVEQLSRFPHAFSGGQRQRIAIARALILRPEFIVCDEPVSALDVSIQAQILNLLRAVQSELGLTYLLIAHDLAAVAYVSDRVAVMYLGQVVELAPTEALYYTPRHPYTAALMSAIPPADPDRPMKPVALEGEPPDPANPPPGCRFHNRCRYTEPRCRAEEPELRALGEGRLVACHRGEELTLAGALELDAGVPAESLNR